MTSRRIEGQHFHAMMDHAAKQQRIMSLASANTEDEERAFNYMKVVARLASNHHPDNVISTCFIRLQIHGDATTYKKECESLKIVQKNVEKLQQLKTQASSDNLF